MSASARCRHSDLHFDIHHTGMSDSNVGSVRLAAKCNICGARMRLSRGVPMGASSRHPTIDPDTDGLGIMLPVIAEGEEPEKEWGFSIWQTICARCCRYLGDTDTVGESAIYNPGRNNGIDLCEPCWNAEDAEIEAAGTNELPDTLAKYRENLRRLGP